MNEKLDSVLKYFKFVLLAFLITVVWTFNLSVFKGTNPWDAFGVIAAFGKVPDISYAFTEFTIGTLILLAIIAASFFIERFFCRYLCPLGAIFAIVSKLRFVKIKKIKQKCGSCGICTDSCVMGIPLYKYDKISSGECILCFKCVSACPRNNTSVDIGKENMNTGVAATLAVTCMTGLYYGGNLISGPADTSIVSSENTKKVSENKIYADGKYEGSGTGFRGAVTTVSVTIEKDTIKDIEVVSYGDDAPYFNRAYSSVANQIVNSQSLEVDAVSGATYSSVGIMDAVEDAINKAKLSSKIASSDVSKKVVEEPNTIKESAFGQATPLPEIDEGTVDNESSIDQLDTVSNQPEAKSTQPEATSTQPKDSSTQPKDTITQSQTKSTQPKESSTEPKSSSNQPKESRKETKGSINKHKDKITQPKESSTEPKASSNKPKDTSTQAESENTQTKISENTPTANSSSKYKDGTYEGSARGFRRGITKVSIVIKNDEITDIEILSHGDDAPYFDSAVSVIEEMIETQSTDVDAVSGATYSSLGIMNAVQVALDQARIG